MTEEDEERLLDLCKREIYARKLGANYEHAMEDRVWWAELKHNVPEEFDRVIKRARQVYGYDTFKDPQLRRTS